MKLARLAAVVAALSIPATGLAQSYGGQGPSQSPGSAGGLGGNGLPNHRGSGDDDAPKKEDKAPAPPAAIPGAEPDVDASVIPADRLAAEMSPNDALFDSISRGDLSAAKDALNRGAQLDAHNVLGQTPTDASIDLNRNDITFLLLSMRGAAPALHGAHPAQTAQAASAEKTRKGRVAIQAKAQKQVAQPMLSADRGTPNPAVGFSGF